MKFLILGNEGSVADIADKAFKGLSAAARKQAEAGLLKLNPELKKEKSIRKGVIVRIPATPTEGKPNRRNSIDPIENIIYEMSGKLDLLEESLTNKFTHLKKRQKNYVGNLKAASKELKTLPNGEASAKALNKYLTDAKATNEKELQLSIEALKALQKTVEDFDR